MGAEAHVLPESFEAEPETTGGELDRHEPSPLGSRFESWQIYQFFRQVRNALGETRELESLGTGRARAT